MRSFLLFFLLWAYRRPVSGGILQALPITIRFKVYLRTASPNRNFSLAPFVTSTFSRRNDLRSHPSFFQDFPYAPLFTQAASLAAIKGSSLLSAVEQTALFVTNPKALFAGKIKF
jgi:hypothetical protein